MYDTLNPSTETLYNSSMRIDTCLALEKYFCRFGKEAPLAKIFLENEFRMFNTCWRTHTLLVAN